MEALQRYDVEDTAIAPWESLSGEFVYWEQHDRKVKALEYQISRLEALLEENGNELV